MDPSSLPPLHLVFGSSDAPAAGSWPNVFEKSVKPVLCYIPMLMACYFVTVLSLQRFTDWKGLKLQRIAGQISMYPAFFILIVTSHRAALNPTFWTATTAADGDPMNNRLQTSDDWCDLFANFYIAVNITQAMGQLQTEQPPLLYQLMAHHVLSIACYTSGFYFDRFRWWTTLAGCCELTNLFLVPVFLSKDYFNEWRKERWFLWNSRLLWGTFVTHRLLLLPCWLGLWFHDRYRQATASSDPIPIHWMEGVVYPVTILGLFLLSILWFLQIDRGLKKQLKVYLEAQQSTTKKKE